MMMLNIPPSLDDNCYAYKMPAPRIKVENGHKTRITNLEDIARAIQFPSECLLKYLGYELNFRVNVKESLLNGSCDQSTIINYLDKLIRCYILCPTCQYPEVVLKSKAKKGLMRECRACGAKTTIDNSHKINAFLLKSLELPKRARPHPSPKSEDLTGPVHGLTLDDTNENENQDLEEEKKEIEPCELFSDIETRLISKAREYYEQYEGAIDKSLALKEMIHNMRKDVPKLYWSKIPYLLFNGMFDINIAKNISKNGKFLKEFYEELETSDSELDLLLSLESFLFVKNNKASFERLVPTILKLFRDEDLFSDEFIIDWDGGKLKSKFMMDSRYQRSVDEEFKEAARQFIDWIKNIEEVEIDQI